MGVSIRSHNLVKVIDSGRKRANAIWKIKTIELRVLVLGPWFTRESVGANTVEVVSNDLAVVINSPNVSVEGVGKSIVVKLPWLSR